MCHSAPHILIKCATCPIDVQVHVIMRDTVCDEIYTVIMSAYRKSYIFLLTCLGSVYRSAPPQFLAEILPELLLPDLRKGKRLHGVNISNYTISTITMFASFFSCRESTLVKWVELISPELLCYKSFHHMLFFTLVYRQ